MNTTLDDHRDLHSRESTSVELTTVFFIAISLCFIIDVSFLIVCIKVLKKTLHHLLIITLIFGDSIFCVTTGLLILNPLISLTNTFITCHVQVFLIFYVLSLNFTTLFVLCIHRHLVLKKNNYGPLVQKIENNKYSIVFGYISLTFVYQLLDSLLVPFTRKEEIHFCNAHALFKPFEQIFIAVAVAPVTLHMICISISYPLQCYRIWKTFFKPKIYPLDGRTHETVRETINNPRTFEIRNQNQMSQSSNQAEENWINLTEVRSITDDQMSQSSNQVEENWINLTEVQANEIDHISIMMDDLDSSSIRMDEDDKDEQRRVTYRSEIDCPRPNLEGGLELNEQRNKPNEIPTTESQRDVEGEETKMEKERKRWELRALATCIILSIQSLTLTSPVIAGFWYEVITGEELDWKTKEILALFLIFNSLTNPFLYTWRIPEVRKEFRRLFLRPNHV